MSAGSARVTMRLPEKLSVGCMNRSMAPRLKEVSPPSAEHLTEDHVQF